MKTLSLMLTLISALYAYGDPVVFSITATANSNALGYAQGQSYEFNWLVNDAYTQNPNDVFLSSLTLWSETVTTSSMVFSDIYGDGLTGAYVQPSLEYGSPDSSIAMYGGAPDFFQLMANAQSGSMGIQVNGNDLLKFRALGIEIGDLSFPASYTDPSTFWSGYTGTYTPSGGSVLIGTSEGDAYFTATGVSIKAIPEPSTIAFLGLFGSGLLIVRRVFLI